MLKLSRYLLGFRSTSGYHTASKLNNLSERIDIHPVVREALLNNNPVVALESTIITHGMPYPCNLETAIEVENCVRSKGSVPATIGILDGRIKVGLREAELEKLTNRNSKTVKCSRRDLSYVLSKNLNGGTTVSGTMIIADMVGIKVFATGGIGGVHRDGHETFDISADLSELGRTPVTVVSSGIKSILDIPRTLEYLETQGVFVASFQCPNKDFPAFYTQLSGVKAPYNVDSAIEVAHIIHSQMRLGLNSGLLIGVPIPQERAIDDVLIDKAINAALLEAEAKGISGKEITPFVLEAISKITDGKSLEANKALIKNNASVASEISKELSEIINNEMNGPTSSDEEKCFEKVKIKAEETRDKPLNLSRFNDSQDNVPVVVGGSILDICLTLLEDDLKLNGATYKIQSQVYGGGVGRNLAEGIFKLHGKMHFISAVGDDETGQRLNEHLPVHCRRAVKIIPHQPTSTCTVLFDKDGDCKLVLGDMKIHEFISPEQIIENEAYLAKAPLVIMDSNIKVDTMEAILDISKKYNRPVFFEPTDMRAANKPFSLPQDLFKQIKFISPNIYELYEIALALNCTESFMELKPHPNMTKDEILPMAKDLSSFVGIYIDRIILTLGHLGLFTSLQRNQFRYYQAPTVDNICNVSGAGDSFTSGFVAAMLSGKDEVSCVQNGFTAAKCALQSESAVPERYEFDDYYHKNKLNFHTL